jgi:hypothetical protein
MDKSIVEKITGSGLAFLGCHRGPDGQCNYLCRLIGQGDYGERFDHDFYAYSKDRNGDLKLTGHFALSITRSAIDTYWIQQIIHDPETFMRKAGAGHLRAMLDRGEVQHKLGISTHSTPEDFVIPQGVHPRIADQHLRNEILHAVADAHDGGMNSVTPAWLYERICATNEAIDRAIGILVTKGHLRDVKRGFSLTDDGYLEAEASMKDLPQSAPIPITMPSIMPTFDAPLSDHAHPVFPQPDDLNATVWRYMPFSRFESLVNDRQLFMSRLSNFPDRFEGSTPHGDADQWEKEMKNAASDEHRAIIAENRDKIGAFRRGFAKTSFVNCWHMLEHENAAMWDRYSMDGTFGEAVVIRTTYAQLKNIIPRFAYIGKVRYLDWTTERLATLNVMEGVMHKRREYIDEREVRIVIQLMSLPGYDGISTPDGVISNGYLAAIDPVALIPEVRLHPDASPDFAERVREFCAAHGLPAPRPSELAGNPTY